MAIDFPRTIRLANFQSFDEEGATIELPRRMNIFVGPNNVGKSKVLQCFQRLATEQNSYLIDQTGEDYLISYDSKISNDDARHSFPHGMSGGQIAGNHWNTVGQYLVECRAELTISKNGRTKFQRLIRKEAGRPNDQFDQLISERLNLRYTNVGPLPFRGKNHFLSPQNETSDRRR